MRDLGLGPVAAALSEDDRAALRRALAQRAPDLRAARAAWRQDMAAMAAVLRAERFDPAALRAALDGGSERVERLIGLSRDLLVEHVAAMDPARRAAFADRLEAAAQRRGGHQHGL
jgi:uncharacterized membrane protein